MLQTDKARKSQVLADGTNNGMVCIFDNAEGHWLAEQRMTGIVDEGVAAVRHCASTTVDLSILVPVWLRWS